MKENKNEFLIYIQPASVAPLFVHDSLWQYIKCGSILRVALDQNTV
jgi:hypothetical protein